MRNQGPFPRPPGYSYISRSYTSHEYKKITKRIKRLKDSTEELKLSSKHSFELSEIFTKFKNLKWVSLNWCKITDLPENLGECT